MGRIKGNTLPVLEFDTGADPTDLGAFVVNFAFVDGEGESLTMADFAAGVSPVAMEIEFALDFAVDSAYDYFWTNAGDTAVAYEWKVSSASTSQTNPLFSGTCDMPAKPRFGVEAGTDEQTFNVTVQVNTWNKAIV